MSSSRSPGERTLTITGWSAPAPVTGSAAAIPDDAGQIVAVSAVTRARAVARCRCFTNSFSMSMTRWARSRSARAMADPYERP